MILTRLVQPAFWASLAVAALGCSGGGPATPSPQTAATPELPAPLAIPTNAIEGAGAAYNSVAGLYSVSIDLDGDAPGVALDPVRTAQAGGDAYAVDVTGFLTESPCGDCLEVSGISYGPSGTVDVDFSLRHPFALPTQPYTSVSRLDLHAFDVMGYVFTEGEGSPLGFANGSSVAQQLLMNADGYSNLLDGAVTPFFPTPVVTEHPYRVFFADPTAGNFDPLSENGWIDPAAPVGHNVFAMGSPYSRVTYSLAIPPGASEIRLGFAVGVAWGQAAKGRGANLGQRQEPVYYLPEFHHKAPWTVTAEITSNTLAAGNPGSNATLDIRLRDWQLGATVGAMDWPNSAKDAVTAPSELESLTIEAPGLLATPLVIDPGTGTGTGVLEDKLFTAIIPNSLSAPAGTYYAWIKATDSRDPGQTVISRDISFNSVADFHTGTLVALTVVVVADDPPVAALAPDPIVLECLADSVLLDASGSIDPNSSPLMYEWDFDLVAGDPLNFIVDEGPSPTATTTHVFSTVPQFVAVRVTNTGALSDIAVVPVTFDAITLSADFDISPHNPSFVQQFPYAVESGGQTLAKAGGYYFLASHCWNFSYTNVHIRLWRSLDGVSWTQMAQLPITTTQPLSTDFALGAGSDGNVYVIYGVYMGPDFGLNWETRIAKIDNFGAGSWSVVHTDTALGQRNRLNMYVDPVTPSLVLAFDTLNNGTQRFFRSTNSGASFTAFPSGGYPTLGMGLHRLPNGDIAMLGSLGATVQLRKSADGGQSWSVFGPGVFIGSDLSYGGSGAIDDTGLNMVYVYHRQTSTGLRVVRSNDGGASWTPGASNFEGTPAFTAPPPASQESHAIIDLGYDAGGGLYVQWFHAYWAPAGAPVNKASVAFSADNGLTFGTPQLVYDCTDPVFGTGQPSWPGMGLIRMDDGCTMLTAFSELQNLRSRTM